MPFSGASPKLLDGDSGEVDANEHGRGGAVQRGAAVIAGSIRQGAEKIFIGRGVEQKRAVATPNVHESVARLWQRPRKSQEQGKKDVANVTVGDIVPVELSPVTLEGVRIAQVPILTISKVFCSHMNLPQKNVLLTTRSVSSVNIPRAGEEAHFFFVQNEDV